MAQFKAELRSLCFRNTLVGGVDVVFCSDQSADSWLVWEVDNLQQKGKTPQVCFHTLELTDCIICILPQPEQPEHFCTQSCPRGAR